MKWKLLSLFLLAASVSTWAQPTGNCNNVTSYTTPRSCADSQTTSTSATKLTIQNNGGLVPTFEYIISGSPATVSIVIQGCGPSGTCDTLDTYTTVANSVRAPTVSKLYDHYTVTPSWTGGTSPSVTVNTTITSARLMPPASLPPSGAAGGDLSGTYPNPTVVATHLSAPLPTAQGGTGQNSTATFPTSGTVPGSATSVVGLFSSCSGTQYLGADGACHTGNPGTVTSVALTGSGNLFSATPGTPVTSSGNVNADSQVQTQSANCVVAGPSSGAAAQPTCRSLIPADLPSAVPMWLQYLGDGSGGALSVPTGTTGLTPVGEYDYTSISISSGATLFAQSSGNPSAPLILRATGACTIAGTISYSITTSSGGIVNTSNGGSCGGGGGGGTAAGVASSGCGYPTTLGAAGASSGGTGGAGGQVNAAYQRMITSGSPLGIQLTNSSAGSGNNVLVFGGSPGGAGGTGAAAGGRGGGAVILDCASINFTGTIDVSGGAGTNSAANNNGGGGGGGGGFVILRSPSLTNSGTINVAGGSGGTCGAFTGCGVGGAGGNGWSKAFSQ